LRCVRRWFIRVKRLSSSLEALMLLKASKIPQASTKSKIMREESFGGLSESEVQKYAEKLSIRSSECGTTITDGKSNNSNRIFLPVSRSKLIGLDPEKKDEGDFWEVVKFIYRYSLVLYGWDGKFQSGEAHQLIREESPELFDKCVSLDLFLWRHKIPSELCISFDEKTEWDVSRNAIGPGLRSVLGKLSPKEQELFKFSLPFIFQPLLRCSVSWWCINGKHGLITPFSRIASEVPRIMSASSSKK